MHTLRQLTFDPRADRHPVWMPDGERIVFSSNRSGVLNLYLQRADGSGAVERLTERAVAQLAYDAAPDGNALVFRQENPSTGSDLHVLSLGAEPHDSPLLQSPFQEQNAEISPDGRWIAFESNETGQGEVWVRPFPNVASGLWQISTGGGDRPQWSRNGRELFYLATDGMLMSVPVQTQGTSFVFGSPMRLLERAHANPPFRGRHYDVAPDGRFLMLKEEDEGLHIVVVLNWFEELKRLTARRSQE